MLQIPIAGLAKNVLQREARETIMKLMNGLLDDALIYRYLYKRHLIYKFIIVFEHISKKNMFDNL